MKIKETQGKLFDGDKKCWIQTKDWELFSLYRLFIVINKIAVNEWKRFISKEYDKRGLPFTFEEALIQLCDYGREGIDLLEPKNEETLKHFCNKYHLNIETFKQTILKEFEK